MSKTLKVEYDTKTILELVNLQKQKHLNLEPGFQRKSVWSITDRRKLIQSVLEGYPVPSVFLYRREENGMPVYDVLDGKQRLETIFMFTKTKPFARDWFEVKFEFSEDEDWDWWSWKWLEKENRTANFWTYKIQVAEVSGDLSDIVDLFVRINSTGKALSTSEKRHARFYTSTFLKESEKLAKRYREFFIDNRIFGTRAIDRMKDVELVSELLASIISGGPIHKKQAVDKAVGNTSIPARTLKTSIEECSATLRAIKRMFPNLRTTRFNHLADFYSLFIVIWEMNQQKLVLTNRDKNAIAMNLLIRFSDGVDSVRERHRKAQGARSDQRMFANYLLHVQQSTDALSPRKRRCEVLRSLLSGLFESKDERRIFSPEQRRLLWNSDDRKKCSQCDSKLDWNNFQVDHKKAHSRGGKTRLGNAAIICASCNASKGARNTAKRKLV